MAYKAVVAFKDLRTGHDYNAGDIFPATGDVDKDRIIQLMTPTSQRGALIEEVSEPVIVEPVVKKKSKKAEEKKEV